mmetsp:Transcript_3149/g.11306  ORF Transcript_3149/g.11306 Transcript_3149/m.11306 type:complete len:437 (-) Transcript_3149:232-1542(-)
MDVVNLRHHLGERGLAAGCVELSRVRQIRSHHYELRETQHRRIRVDLVNGPLSHGRRRLRLKHTRINNHQMVWCRGVRDVQRDEAGDSSCPHDRLAMLQDCATAPADPVVGDSNRNDGVRLALVAAIGEQRNHALDGGEVDEGGLHDAAADAALHQRRLHEVVADHDDARTSRRGTVAGARRWRAAYRVGEAVQARRFVRDDAGERGDRDADAQPNVVVLAGSRRNDALGLCPAHPCCLRARHIADLRDERAGSRLPERCAGDAESRAAASGHRGRMHRRHSKQAVGLDHGVEHVGVLARPHACSVLEASRRVVGRRERHLLHGLNGEHKVVEDVEGERREEERQLRPPQLDEVRFRVVARFRRKALHVCARQLQARQVVLREDLKWAPQKDEKVVASGISLAQFCNQFRFAAEAIARQPEPQVLEYSSFATCNLA